MGLVYCPDCASTVSDRAPACPRCGCPIAAPQYAPPQSPAPPANPLDEIARAQGPTWGYQTPPRRGKRGTQTIELTGKRWKAQMAMGGVLMVAGVIVVAIALASRDADRARVAPGGAVVALAGVGAFVVGAVWYVIARVGAWWNHG